MAHNVKCTICKCTFDRDKIEFVQTGSRRYAHLTCFKDKKGELTEEDSYRLKIYEYTKLLFKSNYNKTRIDSQLSKIMKENKNYTYSGIYKSIVYWYEVKHGDVEKSYYGIGIVPYIYEQAYQYYYNIWLAQENNKDKNVEDFVPSQETIIRIKTPKRVPFIKERHFSLLAEGDEIQ